MSTQEAGTLLRSDLGLICGACVDDRNVLPHRPTQRSTSNSLSAEIAVAIDASTDIVTCAWSDVCCGLHFVEIYKGQASSFHRSSVLRCQLTKQLSVVRGLYPAVHLPVPLDVKPAAPCTFAFVDQTKTSCGIITDAVYSPPAGTFSAIEIASVQGPTEHIHDIHWVMPTYQLTAVASPSSTFLLIVLAESFVVYTLQNRANLRIQQSKRLDYQVQLSRFEPASHYLVLASMDHIVHCFQFKPRTASFLAIQSVVLDLPKWSKSLLKSATLHCLEDKVWFFYDDYANGELHCLCLSNLKKLTCRHPGPGHTKVHFLQQFLLVHRPDQAKTFIYHLFEANERGVHRFCLRPLCILRLLELHRKDELTISSKVLSLIDDTSTAFENVRYSENWQFVPNSCFIYHDKRGTLHKLRCDFDTLTQVVADEAAPGELHNQFILDLLLCDSTTKAFGHLYKDYLVKKPLAQCLSLNAAFANSYLAALRQIQVFKHFQKRCTTSDQNLCHALTPQSLHKLALLKPNRPGIVLAASADLPLIAGILGHSWIPDRDVARYIFGPLVSQALRVPVSSELLDCTASSPGPRGKRLLIAFAHYYIILVQLGIRPHPKALDLVIELCFIEKRYDLLSVCTLNYPTETLPEDLEARLCSLWTTAREIPSMNRWLISLIDKFHLEKLYSKVLYSHPIGPCTGETALLETADLKPQQSGTTCSTGSDQHFSMSSNDSVTPCSDKPVNGTDSALSSSKMSPRDQTMIS